MENKRQSLIVDELKRIESTQGIITPISVVDTARDVNNPLHKTFDWNDDTAAEKYRLHQARVLINTVRVEILKKDVQAYQNVVVEINNKPVQGYISVQKVLSQEDLKNQMLAGVVKEIRYIQQKFKDLVELDELINVDKVEELEKELTNTTTNV